MIAYRDIQLKKNTSSRMQVDPRIDDFLDRFSSWAKVQPEILAVALVGSYAHQVARADSDIDLVIISREPECWIQANDWTQNFGPVSRHQLEDYGRLTSIRVWYSGGPEVEYGLTSLDWIALPLDPGTRQVICDGMVVLFERNALLSPLLSMDHDFHTI